MSGVKPERATLNRSDTRGREESRSEFNMTIRQFMHLYVSLELPFKSS